jgi:hypothetical protein
LTPLPADASAPATAPAPAGGIARSTHIRIMRFGVTLLVTALLAMLAASMWYAFGFWTSLEDADLPLSIYIAMAGGIVFSLAVGVGLMALVFYSNRAGYDERAAGSDPG